MRIIILSLFVLFLSFVVSVEQVLAAQLTLRSSNTSVRQKENLVVDIRAEPSSQKIYTVKSSINFPADLIEVSSWTYGTSWIGLSQPGWDLTNNADGVFLKTAGYPRGFLSSEVFGTVTFLAKNVGSGSISIGNSSAMYTSSNKNDYTKGDALSFSIKKANPKQLFDIRLELDSDVYSQLRDVEARVIFESFGSEPTPVLLRMYLESKEGKILEEKEATITVETKNLYTFKFTDTLLSDGGYVVRVVTSYNGGVTDEFTQAFQIRSSASAWYTSSTILYGGVLIVVFLIVGVAFVRRSRHH